MGTQSFELKRLLTVPDGELLCCDYHPEFGIAYVVKLHGRCLLVVNGVEWRAWNDNEWPRVWNIRLFGNEHVVAWNVPGGIAAVSRTEWGVIPVGEASNVLVSPNYIFVSYSEDSSSMAEPDRLESNVAAVFSKSGALTLSVSEKLKTLSYEGTFIEVSHACAARDAFFFLAYQTPHIWSLDAAAGALNPMLTINADDVIAMSADNDAVHLLERYGNRFAVRSLNRSDRSVHLAELDQEKCDALLGRAAKFRSTFGVQGGAFLTVSNGAAELLTPS